jgi:hypothetical protein
LLKTKRKMSPSDREKHDVEKWFGIWDILFPGVARPEHPCEWEACSPARQENTSLICEGNVNAYDQSDFLANDTVGIISLFEELIQLDVQEGFLQPDDRIHRHYTGALRVALERSASSHAANISPEYDLHNSANRSQSPPSRRMASNTALPRRPCPGRRHLVADDFEENGGFQGASSGRREFSPTLSQPHQPLNRVATPETLPSASTEASPSPARASLLDADVNFAVSSRLQTPVSPSPSHHYSGGGSLADRSSGGQMEDPTEELDQHWLEDVLEYNPDIPADQMDISSPNVAFDEPASYAIEEFLTEECKFHSDSQNDDESLMTRLDFENNNTGPMAPWSTKNDGNKFLDRFWEQQ